MKGLLWTRPRKTAANKSDLRNPAKKSKDAKEINLLRGNATPAVPKLFRVGEPNANRAKEPCGWTCQSFLSRKTPLGGASPERGGETWKGVVEGNM